MGRPPLAKGHVRSASCPPGISDERGHASQMEVQPTTLTPRDPNHSTSTTREATPGLTEDAGSLRQSPTSQPEPSSNSRESSTNLSDSTTAPDELVSSLKEREEGEIPSTPPTTNLAPPPLNLTAPRPRKQRTRRLNHPPQPTQVALTPVIKSTDPGSKLSKSSTNLSDSTTTPDELASTLELEEGEIPSNPPTTNSAPLNPTAPPPRNRHAQGSNRPPQPTLAPGQQQVVQGNGDHNRKRKSSSSTDQAASQSRPNKRRKIKRKQERRFCHELGHKFTGHVFHLGGQKAWDFAKQILQLPIPVNVSKRLVYFCDASIRSLCGGAGIVWPESLTSRKWGGTGVYYPKRTNSTATVELFAIARTLEMAINDIDKERASVNQDSPRDKALFREGLAHTRSDTHDMTKEVFVFTDDAFALSRIDGKLAYLPEEDLAAEIRAISQFSSTLHGLGVHVELHLSPGHTDIPGNMAADSMAKRAQRELFSQGMKSGLTMGLR